MARYNYYQNGNDVICVSHYAKKPVKGVAHCMSMDTFDLEKGKKIAKAKCDLKIARKRDRKSYNEYMEVNKYLDYIYELKKDKSDYYHNSHDKYIEAVQYLNKILQEEGEKN